ncbi:MAG: RsmB/NOP family class I SAM-dependent RNA methyltransferase [Jatrophihabitans sp.]
MADKDPARRQALAVVRAVRERGAYANLVLPQLLRENRVTGRDAALATELGYGTVRAAGALDRVIGACSSRAITKIEPPVLDLLRLGAYQILRTRIPPHAAVSATVNLARTVRQDRSAGFVNAVLRRVTERDWDGWVQQLTADRSPIERLALQHAHPDWIAAAFADALHGDLGETAAALAADDERPVTHLIARPGLIDRAELATLAGGRPGPGPWSRYAVRLDGGDPGALEAVRDGRAGVQDEGSQLCAIAVADAPLDGRDERWLDMCAGPGGKAAVLAGLAAERSAHLTALELREHRVELVRSAVAHWDVDVHAADATEWPGIDGGYDRVLLDAPCTGLGALRRRPEARWRRTPADLADLTVLQGRLLTAALRLVRPGGIVGYVTCSPHRGETVDAVAAQAANLLEARPLFPGVPLLGDGPTVQLWPHRQGTDAMFCAIVQRPQE